MLSNIHRYIFRAVLQTFAFSVVILLFIFTLAMTFRLLREDLPISQLIQVLPFAVLYTLPYILPVSLLTAVSLTYGRLVANKEVLAMRASGMSGLQIMSPGIIPGILLTAVTLPLESSVLPYLHYQQWAVTSTALGEFIALGSGEHKSQRLGASGMDLYIRSYDRGQVEGLVLRKMDEFRNFKVVARTGELDVDKQRQVIILTLDDVNATIFDRDRDTDKPANHTRARVERFVQEIRLNRTSALSSKDMSSRLLREALEELELGRTEYGLHGLLLGPGTLFSIDNRVRADLELRSVTPFASLVFVLIGVPVALILAHDNYLVPFFVSFMLVCLLFFIPYTISKSLSGKGDHALSLLWLGPVIGGAGGLGLVYRASRI